MPCLIGKNVAVIGASRGVGRRIVEATAEEGARVLAVSRQDEPLRQLAQEISGSKPSRSTPQRRKRRLRCSSGYCPTSSS